MQLDPMTAVFIEDCREVATHNVITREQLIEVFWTGGLADDLRAALEKKGETYKMKPEHFGEEVFQGLKATLVSCGFTVIG